MKKLIGTMLFTTAVCGLLAMQPAQASLFGRHSSDASTQTRSVTETKLTRDDIAALQSSLAAKGFYRGSADGRWGPMTSAAVASFQSSRGLQADGMPSGETLAMLGVQVNTVAVSPENIEPASGGDVIETTTTTSDTLRTRETSGFVAIDTDHVNGSTCRLCTNGIIGNGSTTSMRSNEY